MKIAIPMAFIGGMVTVGVIYFIMNPSKLKMLKDMEVDAMNKMNQMMEENN